MFFDLTCMKNIAFFTLSLFFSASVYGNTRAECTLYPPILKKICLRLKQVWREGKPDIYMTGYAWHNRFAYTKEVIEKNQYNELSWGGGLGKGLYDEDGDWHGIYAVAFSDSHKNFQPNIGYSFLKIKPLGQNFHLGVGYTVLVTTRADLFKGYPFPGAAPLLSIEYGRYSLVASYVLGTENIGNVLFVYLKVAMDH